MTQEEARAALAEVAALWAVGAAAPEAVIRVACDALVAGLDSEALRALAGLSVSASTYEIEDALPVALADVDLPFNPPRTDAARLAAAAVQARRFLAGELEPRELVAWMHHTFQHGENDTIEPFLLLEDEYDCIGYTGCEPESIDNDVLIAARRLAGSSTMANDGIDRGG